MKDEPLRVLSIGAGAIGTYIGGSLALNGHHVVFMEQPRVAAELRQGSFHLNIKGIEYEITEPNIAANLDEAIMMGPYDVALSALKSFDTESVLKSMSKFQKDLPPFLCLQNGVDNEKIIANALGEDRVIYGTVTSAIGRRGPGKIILERLRGLGVAKGHPLSGKIALEFSKAGLNAILYPNAAEMKWSKMLTNLITNASSAILDMTPGEIFAIPDLFRLEILQLREALAVMSAMGVGVTNLPETPVKALAFAAKSLPMWLSRPLMTQAVGKGRGEKMPSFHIDLHNGRGKSEVDYLNGAVVRAGEKTGILTPVNKILNDTLLSLTKDASGIDRFRNNPDILLDLIG